MRTKKSPGPSGAFELVNWRRLVGATGIEAVDQRGADGLYQGLECEIGITCRQIAAIKQRVDVLAVVAGQTILGLHEPAGRLNAEDVQVVLDAAADEPAVAVEAVGVSPTGTPRKAIQKVGARPVRTAVTAVDVGENVRGDQVADPYTCGPRIFQLILPVTPLNGSWTVALMLPN